ncbi:MAG: helix-turn-helix domain-containing protein [Chloroflexi bacterium]|nr:helix-turn-helix domain-containing protein [Chloroflexota bacterium]
MNELLTTKQLQAMLQMDRITIYRMLSDGRLPGFKVGGQWRFRRADVEAWLDRQGAAPTAPSSGPLSAADDLLPLRCIQAIQKVLTQAAGLGSLLLNPEGMPLTEASNAPYFCRLILSTDEGRRRCLATYRQVAQGAASPCHAGLRYARAAVAVRGQVAAHLLLGQCVVGEAQPSEETVADLSAACGLNADALRAAVAAVPTREAAAFSGLEGLAAQVAETYAEVSEERLELLERLRKISEISHLGR